MKTQLTKRLVTLGMVTLGAVGILTGCATTTTPTPEPNKVEQVGTPQATSPMGARKMIDVDGNRFVFLNNGEAFEKQYIQIGEKVGEHSEGTLYALDNYDPAFRMAFEKDGSFYICENVGKSDDGAIDIATYLETANLESQVIYADILDHMGANIMNGLSQEDAAKVLNVLKSAKIAELDTADYEAIAKAQTEGTSYMVTFVLDDQTTFTSYMIPSLNYVTIGDYTCVVEDFDAQIGSFFKDLVISENIIMN